MSERLTNAELLGLHRYAREHAEADTLPTIGPKSLCSVLRELIDRRAKDAASQAAADKRPTPPPAQPAGTLRDEFAMRFAVALVPLLGETDAGAAYRMADAMLAERDKPKQEPAP